MANVENSILELLEHQEDAYKNTEKLFEKGRHAAVIFPTGCGKSFVTLKYILEHPDERILFLSPRNSIKEQMYEYIVKFIGGRVNDSVEDIQAEFGSMEKAAQSFIPGIKAMLYQSILGLGEKESVNKVMSKLNPDLIVIDEMHHLKTKRNKNDDFIDKDEEELTLNEKDDKERHENEWGRKFQKLLDMYPEAKVLGLSATPIRTDGANVVERIFENSKAAEISLLEAMEDDIIMPPKYVIPDFLIKDEKETMLEKINKTTGELKEILQEEYNNAVKQSDAAPGIPELMEKNIKEKNGKFIVFCKDIKDMEQKQKEAKEWFGKIDDEPVVYRVSSKHNDSQQQLNEFNNDESEHLKVMYCVGMIDEGVHLNNVSGVILAAKTGSRPTYLQRLGRAISSGKDKKQALVIDLVNNYEILYENRETEQNYITDLESLENTIVWMQQKNYGEYPQCIEESSKTEKRHAKRLERLKNKYEKYIKEPELLKDWEKSKIDEIREIIFTGNEINLWETGILIDKIEENDENDFINDPAIFDNLQIKGARKKFQKILKKMENNKNKHTELIKICEQLIKQGVNLKKFKRSKRIEENGRTIRKSTTLEDIQKEYSNLDITRILDEFEIEKDYDIGKKLVYLESDVNKKNNSKTITDEEKRKVIELDMVKIKNLDAKKIAYASLSIDENEVNKAQKIMSELKENTKGEK